MRLLFTENTHTYFSPDFPEIKWTGVTSLISKFKEPFDDVAASQKASGNKKSKWYGMSPEDIRAKWKEINDRSKDLGHFYHAKEEATLLGNEHIIREGITLGVQKPIITETFEKEAPDQKLQNNTIYPEHMVYLKSAAISGQADIVEVRNNKLYITDHKTNAKIEKESFKGYNGSKKMLAPLAHLDDCNFVHYSLQMSIYAVIILKHNFNLTVGDLTLRHVIFEETGRDKFDYAIYKLDEAGNPIVKEVVEYKVPFLKSEAIAMINWLKDQNTLKQAA